MKTVTEISNTDTGMHKHTIARNALLMPERGSRAGTLKYSLAIVNWELHESALFLLTFLQVRALAQITCSSPNIASAGNQQVCEMLSTTI